MQLDLSIAIQLIGFGLQFLLVPLFMQNGRIRGDIHKIELLIVGSYVTKAEYEKKIEELRKEISANRN